MSWDWPVATPPSARLYLSQRSPWRTRIRSIRHSVALSMIAALPLAGAMCALRHRLLAWRAVDLDPAPDLAIDLAPDVAVDLPPEPALALASELAVALAS